ncbi:unnamed protein product [Phytophthora fragariaefolia]|uniref:Unnamed protein product n=1 Tax=Phytophthora fragariaefolia TaxID=1490495 RepID=A0A9W6YCY6_9STRA|nr:unnamed protein product [Phytophthora fragariaefolia]
MNTTSEPSVASAVVGVVRDATTQLLCILVITMVYLILLLIRQPNLLRFLYYIGIASVFMKVVLICLMLIVARDDYFPQNVRDNVAYGIIGVNMFIFFLLFVRQAYTIIHKMVVACRHKKNGKDENKLDATDINLEFGNTSSNARPYEQVESTPAGGGGDWYEKEHHHHEHRTQYQSQQQYQPQQYQTQTSTMSGYSTTQSSRSGHSDTVPMLEPTPEPTPVATPVPSHSRRKYRAPVSRNQQYSFGGSSRNINTFEVNNTAPTPAPVPAPQPVAEAPIPTYDVLAAYLGTNKTTNEPAYSASPRSGRGQSSRGQHLSSRGQNSSRGLASSRGPPSSRGQSSRGGAAVLSGSGMGSRPSIVPLDAYAGSFSGTDSGISTSSSRRKRSFNADELRGDVHIDDVDIDNDIVAAPSSSSTARQQFAPGASTMSHSFAPGASNASSFAMMERSYVNFSDSAISSISSMGMTPTTAKPDNTFSAAMGATSKAGGYGSSPQGKMSMFSNDSENSFDGDSSGWFKRRSKSVASVNSTDTNEGESQSYELGPLGVTKSAFSARDSVDSYMTMSTFASSRVDFNAQSQHTDKGSDDGRYYPTHRRGTGSSNQSSSNQSFLSAQSDDSMGVDGEKVRYDDHNTLTL